MPGTSASAGSALLDAPGGWKGFLLLKGFAFSPLSPGDPARPRTSYTDVSELKKWIFSVISKCSNILCRNISDSLGTLETSVHQLNYAPSSEV